MKVFSIKTILFLGIVAILVSCSNSPKGDNNVDVIGFYNGDLPCNDCDKLSYSLILKEDGNYQSSKVKDANYKGVSIEYGTWKTENNRVILTSDTDKNESVYDITFNGLVSSTTNNLERAGNDKTNNEIYKVSFLKGTNNDGLMNGFSNQADLYAEGIDWTMSLKNGGDVSIQLGNEEMNMPIGKFEPKYEDWTKTLKAETNGKKVEIVLTKEECSENELEGFALKLIVGGKERNGCAVFLNSMYNVNGAWRLLEVNGNTLAEIEFPKGRPIFELDVLDNIFMGHTGCNLWRGGIKLDYRTLQVRPGPMTRMSCPGQDFENTFVQSMGRSWQYSLEKNQLLFIDGEESILWQRE